MCWCDVRQEVSSKVLFLYHKYFRLLGLGFFRWTVDLDLSETSLPSGGHWYLPEVGKCGASARHHGKVARGDDNGC